MDSICFFGERLKSFIILNINEIVWRGAAWNDLSRPFSLSLKLNTCFFFSQHCRRIYRLIVVLTQWGVFVLWLRCMEANTGQLRNVPSLNGIHFEVLNCSSVYLIVCDNWNIVNFSYRHGFILFFKTSSYSQRSFLWVTQ